MAIMPKFDLKRARPERVVAKRALLVSWWLILSTTGGSVTFARRASSSSSSQLSFRLRGPRLEGTESDQDPDSCPQWSVLFLP